MADAEDAQAAKLNEFAPRRILFARIGSMTYYAGRQKGDEKPKGGGRYNQKNVGHEVFNFANSEGWLYGFVRAKAGSISLGRIDPASGQLAELDNVLVIFVARQRIVGWYDGALVHRIAKAYPKMVSAEMRKNLDLSGTKNYKIHGYQFEVPVEKATLIPTRDRVFEVPAHVKGGFGQSNVCYQYRTNGKVKAGTWMRKALSYVLSYDKANLLTDPTAEKESDEDATIAQEQAAGFQSNPVIRRKVELYAMGKARTQLEDNEYENIQNTSKYKPYDYSCEKNGKSLFVEVKGTQTPGKAIILTRGEVDHVKRHPGQCMVILVSKVHVSTDKSMRVSGGVVDMRDNWKLHRGDLEAIQYVWKVK